MPTSDGVVYGLIGVNVAVFILWRTVDPRFMMENFTVSTRVNSCGSRWYWDFFLPLSRGGSSYPSENLMLLFWFRVQICDFTCWNVHPLEADLIGKFQERASAHINYQRIQPHGCRSYFDQHDWSILLWDKRKILPSNASILIHLFHQSSF